MKLSKMFKMTGRTALLAMLVSCVLAFAVACGGNDNNGGGGGNADTGTTADSGGGGGGADAGTNDTGMMADTGSNADTGTMADTGGGGSCTPLSSGIDNSACSILCQDCGQGQACFAGQSQQGGGLATQCAAAGSAMQGDSCSAPTDCAAGYSCVNGTCDQICDLNGVAPTCDQGTCQQLSIQGGGQLPFGACIVSSDECTLYPDSSNACSDSAQSCAPTASGNKCVTYTSGVTPGTSCSHLTDCGKDQACVDLGQGSKCYQLCDPQGSDCASGEQCGGIGPSQDQIAFYACVAQ